MYKAWTISLWEIADVTPRDKYGFSADDPQCQLDTAEDYVDFLPNDKRVLANAMKYGGIWNMTADDVLDMAYSEFQERAMIHKAITLRKPQYTKTDYFMERTSPKYKARKRR